jgi:hypothetical protein
MAASTDGEKPNDFSLLFAENRTSPRRRWLRYLAFAAIGALVLFAWTFVGTRDDASNTRDVLYLKLALLGTFTSLAAFIARNWRDVVVYGVGGASGILVSMVSGLNRYDSVRDVLLVGVILVGVGIYKYRRYQG